MGLVFQTTCYTTPGVWGILHSRWTWVLNLKLSLKPTETRAEPHAGSTLPPLLFSASAMPPPLPYIFIHPCRSAIPLSSSSPAASRMGVLAEPLVQHRTHGIWRRPPAPLHFCFLLLLILKKGLNKGIEEGRGWANATWHFCFFL